MTKQAQAQAQTNCDPGRVVDHRWAVILAGGDGKRLLPLTRRLSGDDRPKQFCRVLGGETLLDQTLRRVGQIVNLDRTFSVVTKAHEDFYGAAKAPALNTSLLVQPCNRGTAPAIVYSIVRLLEIDPDAVVGIFPSDHYFADDRAFSACVHEAFESAELHTDSVILLGIKPNQPETGYGWIEPGDSLPASGSDPVFRVRRFWEKPSADIAFDLMCCGCLWNSFIMVGRVEAFLSLTAKATPDLLWSFRIVASAFFTRIEEATVHDLYLSIPSISFSGSVLSVYPGNLAVLSSDTLEWADVGDVDRALSLMGGVADGDLPQRMGSAGEREDAYRTAATA